MDHWHSTCRAYSEAYRLHYGRQQAFCKEAGPAEHIWTSARLPQGPLACFHSAVAASGLNLDAHISICSQLLDALQWCLDLGVQAITVYAFSIDNFRRESDEVDALMTLAEEKLLDLLNVGVVLN